MLSLKNIHKQHLNLLIKQDNKVLIEFCKMAIDYLENKGNIREFQNDKIDDESLQQIIHALIYLLLDSCKFNINEKDFTDSMISIGFDDMQATILTKFYQKQKSLISNFILPKFSVTSLYYRGLNWRFETQIASRSCDQLKSKITLELILIERESNTKSSSIGKQQKLLLEINDLNKINKLCMILEQAIAQTKTPYFKKIQRQQTRVHV